MKEKLWITLWGGLVVWAWGLHVGGLKFETLSESKGFASCCIDVGGLPYYTGLA